MFRRLALFTCTALLTVSVTASAGATTRRPPRWYQPLLALPHADLLRVECVIQRESRSTFAHPNLGDNNGNPGQSGIFQMNNQPRGIWDIYVMPVLHVLIWSDELREALHKLDVAYLRFEASASVESYGKLIEARERYEAARRS